MHAQQSWHTSEGHGAPSSLDAQLAPGRKRLLLEILDALHELSNQDLVEERDSMSSLQNEMGGPPDEDPIQTKDSKGIQAFYTFRRHMNDLDRELQNLAQSFRSAGIISTSFRLRTRLSNVLVLFSENATEVFPEAISDHQPRVHLMAARTLQGFPEEFNLLAKDLLNFVGCLHEFPQSKHERLDSSVSRFNGDLKYWGSSLQDFKGQFRDPAVQRYMHDVCIDMTPHLHNVTSALESFIELVIPAIRSAQQQEATTLVSLSGLATFMSAVTATAIQIAFDQADGPSNNSVNVLWFSSLVLSISSAVNSLLVMVWTQSVYRSPRDRVPWWIAIWIGKSHLLSLILSLIAFSVGLVVFTWTSKQALTTCILTTAFTALSTLSLIAVCVWFAFERLIFIRHGGRHLLADIISELDTNWRNQILPYYFKRLDSWGKTQAERTQRVWVVIVKASRRTWRTLVTPSDNHQNLDREGRLPISNPASISAVSATMPMELSERRGETKHALETSGDEQSSTIPIKEESPPEKSMQISSSSYSLNRLQVTGTLQVHQATVSHLQFSPDGRWLATGSWDASSVLFNVAEFDGPFTPHRTLTQPRPVHQVSWAPAGQSLLTNVFGPGNVRVWNKDGVCIDIIERRRPVRAVTWLPSGQGFLVLERDFFSLEGSEVSMLDLSGSTLAVYPLPRFYLHDIAITPDEQRTLSVATVIRSPGGLQPHTARRESRIIVYNLDAAAIESQVPVSQALEVIKISSDGQFVLVSCKSGNKGLQNPTQLWRLDILNNRAHLVLSQTYKPRDGSDVAGPSCFGGRNDELVLILNAGRNGHVSVWTRDSGILLYDLLQPSGDLTSFAWNSGSDSPMLATGSFNGTVRLWTPTLRSPPSPISPMSVSGPPRVDE